MQAPAQKGSVLSITFELCGQPLNSLNGSTKAPFNHSISLLVNCDSQTEIDQLWEKLLVNGDRTLQFGWFQDQFGVCWQIVHAMLDKMQHDPATMSALLTMRKLDISQLEQAYQQGY